MRKLTIFLLLLSVTAFSETVTFQPNGTVGKGTFAFSSEPTENYGTEIYLLACSYSGSSGAAYIEFTALHDSQYQGATVNSATLALYA